jgi:hypothetical protein
MEDRRAFGLYARVGAVDGEAKVRCDKRIDEARFVCSICAPSTVMVAAPMKG